MSMSSRVSMSLRWIGIGLGLRRGLGLWLWLGSGFVFVFGFGVGFGFGLDERSAHAAPPPPGCTDGGNFDGAVIGPTGARYCVDKQCWRFDTTSRTLVPIDTASALTRRSDDLVIVHDVQPPIGPKPPWIGKALDDHTVEVCGPSGCTRLPIGQLSKKDDGADTVASIAISSSGNRVAVVRGEQMISRQLVELYDRASHKRLATIHPKTACADVVDFAGESAVIQEWDCINQGGPRVIASPSGSVIARIAGIFGHPDRVFHVANEHYAFENNGEGKIAFYDVLRGTHATTETSQFTAYAVADNKLHAFERSGRITIFDAAGTILSRATPPTCRWAWENESIGKLTVGMTTSELERVRGKPRHTTKPDDEAQVTATYADGLSLDIQTHPRGPGDPIGASPEPSRVVAIHIIGPSKLTTKAGIAIGSPVAAVDRAYGEWLDTKRSTATVRAFGNATDPGGWRFDIADGKVASIHVDQRSR